MIFVFCSHHGKRTLPLRTTVAQVFRSRSRAYAARRVCALPHTNWLPGNATILPGSHFHARRGVTA